MIIFDELDERFEKNLIIDGFDVCISIDKPLTESALTIFSNIIDKSASDLLSSSICYVNQLKEEYGIGYIDDLSDPQIFGCEENISVYWSSDKGEVNGESIIGVDYSIPDLKPYSLTIGD
ncbi:hypothetical protein BCT62_25600 [Vibrio splendidus]|uniref:hypothetical protein n=1 Tax=Vibrio splendidus TaxID=29497 RepID=UPI000C8493BD|nr:hypothetical protein [Vibrio splendidus]PMM12960.1 hypothetical protein BCT62_25600 [Vibrio splendidus]